MARTLFTLLKLKSQASAHAASLDEFIILARRNMMAMRGGEIDRRSAGAGEKFWQFRTYEQGDRPQDIDWRRSAKGGARGEDIFIRQKQKQDPQRASFWVAADEKMHFASRKNLPTKYEYAALCSLSLMMALAAQGDQITLAGSNLRAAGHNKHLDHLAALLYERENNAPTLDDLTPNHITAKSALILAGDFLENPEEIKNRIHALAAKTGAENKIILLQIFDPAELELPYSGRGLFQTPGTAANKYDLPNIANIKKEYQTRIENHRATLHALCNQYGWHYISARTDEEMAPLLRRMIEVA